MKLFCFGCRDLKNIPLGVKARTWAVATVSDSAMRSRITKAEKNLEPGDVGLLYCNPLHSFNVPFVVTTKADPDKLVDDIWPEGWRLPFGIEPLSDASRRVSKDAARSKWSLMQRIKWKGSISATLNFTGTTIFVPTEIFQDEWREILSDLGT